LPSNIAKKVVGNRTAMAKPSIARKKTTVALKSDRFEFDKFRRNHLTEREKLADRAAELVRDKSIKKSLFGKNPTRENMDYVMSRIKLPYNAPTKVNPYFNGKFNQLNNFSK
jgi:hypothetical protein